LNYIRDERERKERQKNTWPPMGRKREAEKEVPNERVREPADNGGRNWETFETE